MSKMSERNPFVGPRPLQQGEPLYGRSVEVRELFNRVQARRIVVLHAPSGAGKSSLVHAGLIPQLQEAKFDVWKPIRVNLDPYSLQGIPEGTNRYLLSSLVCLEEELRKDRQRSPAELAKLDLPTYIQSRPRRKGWEGRPVVLLFDQFEEVLTTAPHDVQQKRDFFDALGKTLENENIWALFILRDDYLAAFAPYRERIPTQMSTTFRIDLLGLEGAREVAEKLALRGGRAFPTAEKLVRDLATVQVQQFDGTFAPKAGQYVEPVQLQVVCRRLWEAMPEDDLSIEEKDIADYADVSTALADYYAQVVGKIAAEDVSVERMVRDWVGRKLIVGGIRSQVRKGPKQSAELDNDLIAKLQASYLVRAEPRGEVTWFELSHDRLVTPVEENNKAWEQGILHAFQAQARLWNTAQRGPGLLLGREALDEAEEWAAQHSALVTDDERAFLQQSRELREREQAARTRLVTFAITAIMVAIVVTGLGVWAWVLRGRALAAQAEAKNAQTRAEENERRARIAEADAKRASLMAGAREFLAVGPPGAAALLLAEVDAPEKARGWFELATNALESGGVELSLSHDQPVSKAAWSPDNKRILTISGQQARVWNANGSGKPTVLQDADGIMFGGWSPDGHRIVTVGLSTVRIWNIDHEGDARMVLQTHGDVVYGFAWSPDSKRIVTRSNSDLPRVYDTTNGKEIAPLRDRSDEEFATSLAWSPDGKRVIATYADGIARVFDMDGSDKPLILKGHRSGVHSAAWSPDGKQIITASDDHTVRVWNANGSGKPVVLEDHSRRVHSVAWSADSKYFVTTSANGTAQVWHANRQHAEFRCATEVISAAFSPDGQRMMIVCSDGTVEISHYPYRNRLVKLHASWNGLMAAAWSPDGKRILTNSGDETVRVWNANGPENPIRLTGRQFYGFPWSPDGSQCAVASETGLLIVRVDGSGDSVQLPIPEDFRGALWSPDGKRIAMLSTTDCTIRNTDGSSVVVRLKDDDKPVGCTNALWSLDGNRLVTTFVDETVRVWNTDGSGKPLVLHCKSARAGGDNIAWSPDGKRIVFGCDTARVVNADGSGEIELNGHTRAVYSVAWSPDGKRIVTVSQDSTARVWNANTGGESLYTFKGHTDGVTNAAWSPDSNRIVTTSEDKTAQVWNSDGSGTPLLLRGHEQTVWAASWSPDGKRIVTTSDDSTTRVYNADGSGDPWLIQASGPAVWSLDGKRILAGEGDARSYVVDIPQLQGVLRRATTDCLTAEQRQTYLLENEMDARTRYELCEQSHGRTLRPRANP